jgi:hypothetical protein
MYMRLIVSIMTILIVPFLLSGVCVSNDLFSLLRKTGFCRGILGSDEPYARKSVFFVNVNETGRTYP